MCEIEMCEIEMCEIERIHYFQFRFCSSVSFWGRKIHLQRA